MKRPWIIYGLAAVFIASLVQGLQLLFTFDSSISNAIFSYYGLEGLFQIALVAVIALDGLTVYFLLAPKPMGFFVALGDMLLTIGVNAWSFMLGEGKLDLIREAFIESREARGLKTHEEKLDMMFSPDSWMIMNVTYLSFELLIVILLIAKRGYFKARR